MRIWIGACLVVAACSGGGSTEPPAPDAGPNDKDAGYVIRDAGADVDMRPRCGNGVCEDGRYDKPDFGESVITCSEDCGFEAWGCSHSDEGCRCGSTYELGDEAFSRDDCAWPGTLCVPWNRIGRADSQVPDQTCVRPCETDADCGTDPTGEERVCADIELPEGAPQLGRACADRRAEIDEHCGWSLTTDVRVIGARVYTGDEMVACGAGATCVLGVDPTFHSDEGVCVIRCGREDDPPCPSAFPYCNPRVMVGTSSTAQRSVGVCSAQRGLGAVCEIRSRDRAGLASRCDTAGGELRCLTQEGSNRGHCVAPCEGACADDPQNGAMSCVADFFDDGFGVCAHDDCGTFPDTCDGDGWGGDGRYCRALTEAAGACVDREYWSAPSKVDSTGALAHQGDNCTTSRSIFCPEPAECVDIAVEDGGLCMLTCDRDAPDAIATCIDGLTALGFGTTNATCAQPFGLEGHRGICGSDD